MAEVDKKLIEYAKYLNSEIDLQRSSVKTSAIISVACYDCIAVGLERARKELYNRFPGLEEQVQRAQESKLAQKTILDLGNPDEGSIVAPRERY